MINRSTNNENLNFITKMADRIPNYEHTKVSDYRSDEIANVRFKHSELREKGVYGNVISSFREENGELNYIIDPLSHLLIVGSTGTGKSTGPTAAQINATFESGKCSMIVVDSKGELYERYACRARSCGYKVKLFNLKDALHSEGWGIFYDLATYYRDEYLKIGANVVKNSNNGQLLYSYKNNVYKNKEDLAKYFERELKTLLKECQSRFRDIVAKLFPVESQKDPHWEKNGMKMLVALGMALVIDQFSLDEKKRTTANQVNFSNMKEIFDSFHVGRRGAIEDNGFLSDRGYDSFLFSEVKRIFFENADTTSRNYIGFVDDAFTKYNFQAFLDLTLTSTVKVDDFVNENTILFVTYDEMNLIGQSFLDFFISGLLEELKRIADRSVGLCLSKPVLFIIDEFASLPKNSSIVNFVAYGRSRNIFIHYVLQDYSQLEFKYAMEAKTLLNNCNNTIYLGTNDYETIQRFSQELGRCTIVSPHTVFNTNETETRYTFEERPVVTCSELSEFKQGEVKVKRSGLKTLNGHFEKSYECPEYTCPRAKLGEYVSELDSLYYECQYDTTVLKKEDDEDDEHLWA